MVLRKPHRTRWPTHRRGPCAVVGARCHSREMVFRGVAYAPNGTTIASGGLGIDGRRCAGAPGIGVWFVLLLLQPAAGSWTTPTGVTHWTRKGKTGESSNPDCKGYRLQETPQVVDNLIDGDLTSYWNPAGCMDSVGYYYAVFDLGATSTISALRMAATPSGNHNPDEITWYSCSSASDFAGCTHTSVPSRGMSAVRIVDGRTIRSIATRPVATLRCGIRPGRWWLPKLHRRGGDVRPAIATAALAAAVAAVAAGPGGLRGMRGRD